MIISFCTKAEKKLNAIFSDFVMARRMSFKGITQRLHRFPQKKAFFFGLALTFLDFNIFPRKFICHTHRVLGYPYLDFQHFPTNIK